MSSKMKNDNKKMQSIVRRINSIFTGKFIYNIVKLDIMLVIFVAIVGIYAMDKATIGSFDFFAARELVFDKRNVAEKIEDINKSGNIVNVSETDIEYKSNMVVYFLTSEEATYLFDLTSEFRIMVIGLLVIVISQVLSVLVTSSNMEYKIKEKLRPINEMAKTTEKISNMTFDEKYFQTLEDAISNVNASSLEDKIETNNKELKGIENALNNLIERIRESYKQQSRFVSDASHELRTPIAVIQGYVNMLDRWGKEDEGILEESIEAIKHESAHMQKLVEQLLFLARGDSGRNTLKIEEFSLYDLMKEVYEESVMIDEKHRYVFEGEEVKLAGDISMIKQSVRILVDNAAKYTEENDVITIRTGQNEEGVFYSIQDNGIGMNEADVSHMFERFYRSDKARNRQTGGTGLGLSIARWIVDRHNGYFNILSRPDIGTRITVVFR